MGFIALNSIDMLPISTVCLQTGVSDCRLGITGLSTRLLSLEICSRSPGHPTYLLLQSSPTQLLEVQSSESGSCPKPGILPRCLSFSLTPHPICEQILLALLEIYPTSYHFSFPSRASHWPGASAPELWSQPLTGLSAPTLVPTDHSQQGHQREAVQP